MFINACSEAKDASGSVTNHTLCLYGCPFNTDQKENNIFVDHGILVLSSNKKTKFADWVAYKVVKANIGKGGKRKWKKDPKISKEYTLIPSDYKGANAKCQVDRGHQAPLASFASTDKYAITNYLSNITPQKAHLNRGAWVKLESAVRNLARGGMEVFVVTGTYYTGKPICTLPVERVKSIIPNGYFKIIAVKNGNNVRVSQFLFPQEVAKHEGFCKYQSSLSEIEKITKLKIFPLAKKLRFKSLSKDLGC